MSTESTIVRLYKPEWVVVYTVACTKGEGFMPQTRESLAAQTWQHFQDLYEGRVRPGDVTVQMGGTRTSPIYRLVLRLPTCRGEFKTREYAERFAQRHGYDKAIIVPRGSKADHELRNYGLKMLPKSAKPGSSTVRETAGPTSRGATAPGTKEVT